MNQGSICSYEELKDKHGLKDTEKFRYLGDTEKLDKGPNGSRLRSSYRSRGIFKKEEDKKRRLIGATYEILIEVESN